MAKQVWFNIFIWFCLLLALNTGAYSQEPAKLTTTQTIEREIKGGETHFYTVTLGANQTARIEIEQKGVDVSLAAYKPAGESFIESQSPSGVLGNDSILVTAAEAGKYKIEVSPADPRAGTGKYTIKLIEIRPTVAQDFEINAAAKKLLELGNETSELRQKGTREGRRQALEKFQEIIAVSKIKQDKTWEVVALISSGLVYEQLGELQNSLDFYLRGLDLTRAIGNRQYEASAVNNIGYSLNIAGDYEKAIFYYNQSIEMEREVGNLRGEAISLNNVGSAYMFLGDLAKAQEFYQKSLVLRRELKDERGEANTLNNLGLAFAKAGDTAKALEFHTQSYELRRRAGDRRGEATSLGNLGKTAWTTGDKTKAFEYFTGANALAITLGERRIIADTFYWLAICEREKGNLPKAFENIENGLQIVEQIRGELISPELRLGYFSTVQQFYEFYTDLLVARYEKSKDAGDIALALEASERARTRSLVELLQEARINIKQGVDTKSLERAQDLQDALNAKYRQRTQLLSGKSTAEQITKITNEITALSTETENLQIKIRRENPRYAGLTFGANLSGKEIQNLLDDETVLLEYKLGSARSFLWLVTKNSTEIFTLPSRSEIETTARNFYTSITSRDKTKEAQTAEFSKRLSEILLAPVAGKIENKRLAIVADGVLQFIPFASLQIQNSKSQVPAFLTETNEIVALPSASVLAELRQNASGRKTPGKAIAIFADAVFEANDTRLSIVPRIVSEKPAELGKVLRDFNLGENLPRLLSSRVEAKNISAFVPKNQSVLNVDFEANRENAMSETLAEYKILHFATHGLLDTSRPELSGLVLSLFDENGKPQDGFLRLNQIYNLNLNSDLVVLSACQTALGKDVRGEGLIGLTRGFMYAGAKRVVASLWKVDDAATAEFMKRFYQNLLQKKLSAAAALRQAQNEMRQIPRFKSPYFWAGFTLQGEWKEREK
ncbi:MAG: CHAT domain-containing protein [Pyrinomonadaceae bacterium]